MIGYSETMTKTIQSALSPLLVIGSLCGLAFLEYPPGRIRPYLSCLYLLITWSLYGCLWYYLIVTHKLQILFIRCTNMIILIAAFTSMLISLFRFKELKTCLRKLSILDDTLEVLGTPKEYRQLYNLMIRVAFGWILMSCFANALDALPWIYSGASSITLIFVPLCTNHIFHVNTINDLTWGTILRYTGSRFQRINEHIHNLLQDDVGCTGQGNAIISVSRRKTETKKCKQSIWTIMHTHLQLSRISRELNEVFSMQMTLEMAYLFTFHAELFIQFYDLYVDYNVDTFYNVSQNLINSVWATVFTAKLLALNCICQTVCDKANATIAILYKFSNDNVDEGLREQILQFILQIKQREVRFSGMGLFYFGYSFIRKFFLSVVTLVVIIIQMRSRDAHNDTINHVTPSINAE